VLKSLLDLFNREMLAETKIRAMPTETMDKEEKKILQTR